MKKFISIIKDNSNLQPKQQQEAAGKLFPNFLKESAFNLWQLGDNIPTVGSRLLIGVAAQYSLEDLELLDLLNEKLLLGSKIDDFVDVFDVSLLHQMDDFEKYIEGLNIVFQTPVAGLWKNGKIVKRMWGAAARNWLIQRYQL